MANVLKDNKKFLMGISTCICLLPVILGVSVYGRLPDQIPIHFDSLGNPDDYVSKFMVCFGMSLFFTLINFVLHFNLETNPKKQNQSPKKKAFLMWLMPVLSVIFVPVSMFFVLKSVR